jgi:hypothetical protein
MRVSWSISKRREPYTSIIVSAQVIAEQSFHSVFLAACVRLCGTRTFQTPSVVGQWNQACGLFDYEREHSF